jgi:hypothetical protein
LHTQFGLAEDPIELVISLAQTRNAKDDQLTLIEERLQQSSVPIALTRHTEIMPRRRDAGISPVNAIAAAPARPERATMR